MPTKSKNFIPFLTPSHLIMTYDKGFKDNRIQLYPLQKRAHLEFAKEPEEEGKQNETLVVAANDSGKSKMILAPCIAWHATQFDKSETVLTSASGTQLDKQTARYLKDLCRSVNSEHKEELFEIQYRQLKFKPTDSYIDLFATDESTKAEGWHQRDYGSALALIMDEAKAIQDDIFTAYDRCHDAQRVLKVSSPAIGTQGRFYQDVTQALSKIIKITAYDCPHIHPSRIQKIIDTYGINSPITRSIIFAEFTELGASLIINAAILKKILKCPPLFFDDGKLRVGGDIAAGGDENVLTIFRGNKQIELRCFREPNTVKTKELIVAFLGLHKVDRNSDDIFIDDGHVGHSVIDMLWNEGWNIQRVINQSKPLNSRIYGNRGAELWFNVANLINNEEIILLDDGPLIKQLVDRKYKQSEKGSAKSTIILESKQEVRASGQQSPDRADATVLAFTRTISPYFNLSKAEETQKPGGIVQTSTLIEWMDAIKFGEINNPRHTSRSQSSAIGNSVNTVFSKGRIDFSMVDELSEQLKMRKHLVNN